VFTCGVRRAPQPACPGSLPTLYALLWLVGASDEAQGLGCRLSPVGARGAPAAPASELAKLHNPRLSRRSPFAIAWPANALGPPPPAEIGLPLYPGKNAPVDYQGTLLDRLLRCHFFVFTRCTGASSIIRGFHVVPLRNSRGRRLHPRLAQPIFSRQRCSYRLDRPFRFHFLIFLEIKVL
jgi:hypothetical protein